MRWCGGGPVLALSCIARRAQFVGLGRAALLLLSLRKSLRGRVPLPTQELNGSIRTRLIIRAFSFSLRLLMSLYFAELVDDMVCVCCGRSSVSSKIDVKMRLKSCLGK
jgi:hypothetical protein